MDNNIFIAFLHFRLNKRINVHLFYSLTLIYCEWGSFLDKDKIFLVNNTNKFFPFLVNKSKKQRCYYNSHRMEFKNKRRTAMENDIAKMPNNDRGNAIFE